MFRDVPLARSRRAAARPASFLSYLLQLQGLRRQRRALARLDDAALRDLGLTRSEALHEARRAFWDAPSHWRR